MEIRIRIGHQNYSDPRPVLRIRNVYPGSWFLPIPDPKTAAKERDEKNLLSYFFFVATNFTKLGIILFLKCWTKKFGPILQGCGSVFIFSGSGSRVWCWRPIRIRIRIEYGSRALMTKNWKKNTAENFFYIFFWSKTAIYLSLGLHKVCPSYRRSLQFSKEAI